MTGASESTESDALTGECNYEVSSIAYRVCMQAQRVRSTARPPEKCWCRAQSIKCAAQVEVRGEVERVRSAPYPPHPPLEGQALILVPVLILERVSIPILILRRILVPTLILVLILRLIHMPIPIPRLTPILRLGPRLKETRHRLRLRLRLVFMRQLGS